MDTAITLHHVPLPLTAAMARRFVVVQTNIASPQPIAEAASPSLCHPWNSRITHVYLRPIIAGGPQAARIWLCVLRVEWVQVSVWVAQHCPPPCCLPLAERLAACTALRGSHKRPANVDLLCNQACSIRKQFKARQLAPNVTGSGSLCILQKICRMHSICISASAARDELLSGQGTSKLHVSGVETAR
eukprot:365596-Chlamydomonas_euryale.AAC.27